MSHDPRAALPADTNRGATISVLDALARTFVDGLPQLGDFPDERSLERVAADLRALAALPAWSTSPYRAATVGEERLYELATREAGPALYLVSDGVGVVSSPHEHKTWAIVVGIRGRESNRRYTLRSAEHRTVDLRDEVSVGPGEALVLEAADIHATHVFGEEPTYHLHLYGQSLRTLPAFATRCFRVTT